MRDSLDKKLTRAREEYQRAWAAYLAVWNEWFKATYHRGSPETAAWDKTRRSWSENDVWDEAQPNENPTATATATVDALCNEAEQAWRKANPRKQGA